MSSVAVVDCEQEVERLITELAISHPIEGHRLELVDLIEVILEHAANLRNECADKRVFVRLSKTTSIVGREGRVSLYSSEFPERTISGDINLGYPDPDTTGHFAEALIAYDLGYIFVVKILAAYKEHGVDLLNTSLP